MQERHTDYERYFRESEESCQKYYLPYVSEYLPSLESCSAQATRVAHATSQFTTSLCNI